MKNNYTRIFLKPCGEVFGLLNFSTSKDNSFHFHIYEEANQELKYHPIEKLQGGRLKIELKNLIGTGFIRNKFTFHPSGTFHSSDINRNRLKDGLNGISFKDIVDYNLILVIAPKEIKKLLKKEIPKKGVNLILELANDVSPFTVNFEVFRKSQKHNLKKFQ
ncbi:hypothetical protein KXJ69_06565 [Aureisphaera sp. CAU 1614]|uniref:Uncharacterized protein n=1 Tax=Halomarinibacterium sedimenti TaxID=2857106 RepID=A0A9X1FP22_9FLAO|nr:hypothetical protein [Halomarinibacterium sedimenti]MBW2937763.1 hypothetical protein [Halomarinibacterium sedimenti]